MDSAKADPPISAPASPPSRIGDHDVTSETLDLKSHIRGIPDFPKPGILFYDISTLLRHGPAWRAAMARLARLIRPHKPDLLAGIESRGFLVAAPLALELGLGFIMLRKPRKLPGLTIGLNYALEYGTDRIEIQADAVRPGDRVVILDDLLATGGTAEAGIKLVERLGGNILGCAFVVDLPDLGGRKRLEALGMDVHALCAFEGA